MNYGLWYFKYTTVYRLHKNYCLAKNTETSTQLHKSFHNNAMLTLKEQMQLHMLLFKRGWNIKKFNVLNSFEAKATIETFKTFLLRLCNQGRLHHLYKRNRESKKFNLTAISLKSNHKMVLRNWIALQSNIVGN